MPGVVSQTLAPALAPKGLCPSMSGFGHRQAAASFNSLDPSSCSELPDSPLPHVLDQPYSVVPPELQVHPSPTSTGALDDVSPPPLSWDQWYLWMHQRWTLSMTPSEIPVFEFLPGFGAGSIVSAHHCRWLFQVQSFTLVHGLDQQVW